MSRLVAVGTARQRHSGSTARPEGRGSNPRLLRTNTPYPRRDAFGRKTWDALGAHLVCCSGVLADAWSDVGLFVFHTSVRLSTSPSKKRPRQRRRHDRGADPVEAPDAPTASHFLAHHLICFERRTLT